MPSRCLVPLAAAVLLLLQSSGRAVAAGPPTEIQQGNLMVVRTATSERWFIAPHDGRERFVLVISVSADGSVAMTTLPLPERQPTDPGDPDTPPTQSLTQLVATWATEANDPTNRVKLAAAYQATAMLAEQGKIVSIEQLVGLQRLTNTTLLGTSASKWKGFFTKLGTWLDANTPADLAGYVVRWLEISNGLKGE